MVEIENGIFWDTALGLYEQTEEVRNLLSEYLKNPPAEVAYEDCDSDNKRAVYKVYAFGNAFFKVEYIYVGAPDSNEWAGIKDKIYTVYGT